MKMANEVRLIDANRITYQVAYLPTTQGAEKVWAATEQAIENVLTIDPESLRPKGRWERTGEADYKCSVCGFRFTSGDPIEMFPYCRCGCKMEG